MDYKTVIGALAAHYWGEQNHALSTPGVELRFGRNGSKSVDLAKATWFDHEADKGGGAADLVKFMEPNASIADRLEQFGLPKQADKPRRETVWDYVDEQGEIRYQVVRIDQGGQKTYRQRQIGADKQAIWNMAGVIPLPYRLPEIVNSTLPIFICEGEKAADAVAALGLVATTNHGGAGKWAPALNDHFRGRHVVILPDNDEPGERHARIVADALTGTARTIRIVRLPDLPPKGDAVDWAVMGGDKESLQRLVMQTKAYDPLGEPLPALPEPTLSPAPTPTGTKIDLIAWDAVQDIPVRWLVEGLIPTQGFCALYGKPGSYKSFVALYLAAMIATGAQAFGRPTEAGDIVYLMGEGGAGLKPRRDALIQHYGLSPGVRVHFIRAQLNLRSTDADGTAMIQAVQAQGLKPALLIIDTLAKAFGAGNENASEDMGAFILQCGRIQDELQTAVLIVHHSGKDEARGQRGHSSLLGACDAELEVVKVSAEDSPERVGQLTVTKQKDGEDGIRLGYKMQTVALGAIDLDIKSLVVEPMLDEEMAARKKRPKAPTGNQKALLEALEIALNEAGQSVGLEQIPRAARCVRLSMWRQYFYQISPQEDETKRKTWNRASQQLKDGGTISIWGEWVWRNE
jgi:hypothetical protein